MRRRRGRAVVVLAAAFLVAGCTGGTASIPDLTSSPAYQHAYQVGLDAYVYGLPLLVTDATFRTMTSVNVPEGAFGPVNRVNSVRSPNTSSSSAVVAPGATSLSSIAWIDLSGGPQVLHVPKVTGHAFVLALIDPYTENIATLGSASATPPGDYLLTDPQQRAVGVPTGASRLDVDYSRIWLIGSTQLLGPDDVAAVDAIQDGYTLTPLSRYRAGTTSPAPSPSPTDPAPAVTAVTTHLPATGLEFYDSLGALLAQFDPPAADDPALEQFATVGVGPGLTPSDDTSLDAATLQGLADAAAAGPARIEALTEQLFAGGFDTHQGYLLGGFGRYGTDYDERAVISQIGLGAFVPHQAIYAMTWTDRAKRALDGSTTYTLHLAAPPPTLEGWSFTLYTLTGGLIPNAANRYALTSSSPLTRNADGSIDLTVGPTPPTSTAAAANWLPTQAGQGFEAAWRLFAPEPAAIDGVLDGSGWQPPPISPAG